jgi:hypothetical protein
MGGEMSKQKQEIVKPVSGADGLDADIAAYASMQQDLEEKHMGKWVLFYQGKLVSVYDSFDNAAKDAVARFGRGPYLIRQVGAPAITLPASVMYRPVHA